MNPRSARSTKLVAAALIPALLVLLAAGPSVAAAADGGSLNALFDTEPDFLPVDEAFVLSMAQDGNRMLVRWEMPDGYYLYRHRFGASLKEAQATDGFALGELAIPPGKAKFDDYFGDVEVYYHEVEVQLPVYGGPGPVEVGIAYQGCADAGLCYPPETRWMQIDLAGEYPAPNPVSTAHSTSSVDSAAPTAAAASDASTDAAGTTESGRLADVLASSRFGALIWFFLGGIALAFTPCVLPMVPILSSIIVGEGESVTRSRALTLSIAYVLGMAVTYAALGVAVGLFGAQLNLQAALQSPLVLTVFAAVFVALAMSMFGFYELRLPSGLANRLNEASAKVGGGRHASVAVMGSLSSLVVSPCVSAPLAGALIYISTTGDAVLGGLALLALGVGMGVPLIVLGASGGHLLPRAGAWMNAVKAVFGVLLLAVAVWLLERVVPPSLTLALWAALAIGAGVYLGALDFSPRQGWGQLWKACGALGFVYGVLLLIGAASGGVDPLKPLGSLHAQTAGIADGEGGELVRWRDVETSAELEEALAAARAARVPALVDLYADWCISCKVMERSVFPQPDVRSALSGFWLIRLDVTENSGDQKALMDRYGLFGPPSMVFFDENGVHLGEFTVQGELGATSMRRHLDAVLARISLENVGDIAVKNR